MLDNHSAFERQHPSTTGPEPFSRAELETMFSLIDMGVRSILNDDPYRKPKK